MEWLKSILAGAVADDKVDELIAKVNAEFPKHAVPKDKYNEVSAQNKTLSDKNKELDDLMAGLKGKADSAEAREAEIAKLKADVEGTKQKYEQQIAQLGKRSALKDLLVKNKAHPDALDLLVESYSAKIELDDKGGIKEADKFLETIKTEKGGLFVKVEPDGNDKNPTKPNADVDLKTRAAFRGYLPPDPK